MEQHNLPDCSNLLAKYNSKKPQAEITTFNDQMEMLDQG